MEQELNAIGQLIDINKFHEFRAKTIDRGLQHQRIFFDIGNFFDWDARIIFYQPITKIVHFSFGEELPAGSRVIGVADNGGGRYLRVEVPCVQSEK